MMSFELIGNLFWGLEDDWEHLSLIFLHPHRWIIGLRSSPPAAMPWPRGGHGKFPTWDLELGHMFFFGQHVRRHYMSKDLPMLRWLVWSFGHLSILRWSYPGKPLAQGEREAYGGGLITASPAEPIEVSRALADPLTFAQETDAYRCMPWDFRVFLHSGHAVANIHMG